MAKLILLRHGETQKNIGGLIHSPSDPEELNEKGRKQIEATANHLKAGKVDVVYSSNEKRARQSGEIISQILGLPLNIIGRFQERNWGELSGRPWSEIKQVLDQMTLKERYIYSPPKGESWREFENRLVASIKKVVEDNPGKNILVVSHGGAIRALIPFLLGEARETSFNYDPDNASLTVFEVEENGIFIKETVNGIDHLTTDLKSVRN